MWRLILLALLLPSLAVAGPSWKRSVARFKKSVQPRMEMSCPQGLFVSAIRSDGSVECAPVVAPSGGYPVLQWKVVTAAGYLAPGKSDKTILECPNGFVVDHWGFSTNPPESVVLKAVTVTNASAMMSATAGGADRIHMQAQPAVSGSRPGMHPIPTQVVFEFRNTGKSARDAGFTASAWCVQVLYGAHAYGSP